MPELPQRTIMLNEPRTLTLSPNSLAMIMDALSELPFKKANPVIQEIFAQLETTTEIGSAVVVPPAPTVPASPEKAN